MVAMKSVVNFKIILKSFSLCIWRNRGNVEMWCMVQTWLERTIKLRQLLNQLYGVIDGQLALEENGDSRCAAAAATNNHAIGSRYPRTRQPHRDELWSPSPPSPHKLRPRPHLRLHTFRFLPTI